MKLYSPDRTSPIWSATGFKDNTQNVFVSKEYLVFQCHPPEEYVDPWPTNPSSFISEYSEAARRAEITQLEAIFEGLDMERESIDQILDKHGQNVSKNYYPPCEKSNLGHTFGMCGHTDTTLVTIQYRRQMIRCLKFYKVVSGCLSSLFQTSCLSKLVTYYKSCTLFIFTCYKNYLLSQEKSNFRVLEK
ncbi:hypothetical protein NC651_004384 [Populus alba x Populus x berolinensis]|nr:hypothetical protein NC651_004384 [Populus alba x Populus x berolinensis]